MSKDEVVCAICLKPIDKKDSYYLIQSYKLGTFLGRKHYHWNCFNEKVEGTQRLTNKAIDLVNKTTKLLEKNGIPD